MAPNKTADAAALEALKACSHIGNKRKMSSRKNNSDHYWHDENNQYHLITIVWRECTKNTPTAMEVGAELYTQSPMHTSDNSAPDKRPSSSMIRTKNDGRGEVCMIISNNDAKHHVLGKQSIGVLPTRQPMALPPTA